MDALEHLRSMWAEKTKRSTKLIVPSVTHGDPEGSLNNDSWAFKVPYAFRDALDIKYEERRRDKTPYMVWTQGPCLRFKEGDLVHSKDGSRVVQVRYASPMGWDVANNEMYQGSVDYVEYDGSYTKIGQRGCSQMEFLELLIRGS